MVVFMNGDVAKYEICLILERHIARNTLYMNIICIRIRIISLFGVYSNGLLTLSIWAIWELVTTAQKAELDKHTKDSTSSFMWSQPKKNLANWTTTPYHPFYSRVVKLTISNYDTFEKERKPITKNVLISGRRVVSPSIISESSREGFVIFFIFNMGGIVNIFPLKNSWFLVSNSGLHRVVCDAFGLFARFIAPVKMLSKARGC